MESAAPAARIRLRAGRLVAWLALAAALLCALSELLAGPAYRMTWLSLGAAIATMRWAATIALGGAAAAGAAALLAAAGARRTVLVALAALGLNLLVAAPPLWMYLQAQRLPRIHDISTDSANPPRFVAVVPLRKGARNAMDYSADTAAQQRAGYPDIVPLALAVPPAQALQAAEQAARAMGWDLVDVRPDEGRIEATDTTLLFGFKDDIVIRITPAAGGSVVDVRSLSRVGVSDFGTNAERVRAFLRRLR